MPLIESSLFSQYEYNDASWVLSLTFKTNGKTHHYQGVPPEVAHDFVHTESSGRYYNANIKGQYDVLREDELAGAPVDDAPHPADAYDQASTEPVEEIVATDPTPSEVIAQAEEVVISAPVKAQSEVDVLVAESKAMLPAGQTIVVVSDAVQYTAVAAQLQQKVNMRDRMFKLLDPIRETVYAAYKKVMEQQKAILDPMDRSIAADKSALLVYDAEQRRIAAEEQRRMRERAEAEAEADRKRRSEELTLRAAQEAQDRGDEAGVQSLFDQPIEAPRQAVYVPQATVATPAVSGMSGRKNWKARVTSMEDLVLDVAEGIKCLRDPKINSLQGHASIKVLQPAQTIINQLGKANEDTLNIPGLEAYDDRVLAVKKGE